MCNILDDVVDDVVGHMGRLPNDGHDLVTAARHWRVGHDRGWHVYLMQCNASRFKDARKITGAVGFGLHTGSPSPNIHRARAEEP
jgi:hypothetical protein